jgi:hypothetical protein
MDTLQRWHHRITTRLVLFNVAHIVRIRFTTDTQKIHYPTPFPYALTCFNKHRFDHNYSNTATIRYTVSERGERMSNPEEEREAALIYEMAYRDGYHIGYHDALHNLETLTKPFDTDTVVPLDSVKFVRRLSSGTVESV